LLTLCIFGLIGCSETIQKENFLVEIRNDTGVISREENPSAIFGSSINGNGYGIVLSSDTILTAHHVIPEKKKDIKIVFGEQIHQAKKIKSDEKNDVALLETTQKIKGYSTAILSSKAPEVGEKVYILQDTQKTGEIIAFSGGLITHTIPLVPGDSGSPLLNKKGEVIGINIRAKTDSSLGYARYIGGK
ncbi:serine protease, partial [Candidatus Gracilibacteria bacterium]|nr:serine protease [Candidatus Gracilibacteria bacterium]